MEERPAGDKEEVPYRHQEEEHCREREKEGQGLREVEVARKEVRWVISCQLCRSWMTELVRSRR